MWDLFENVSSVLNVVSTATEVFGAFKQADAKKDAAKAEQQSLAAQAAQFERNAARAEFEARDAELRGGYAAERSRVSTRRVLSTQRAAIAANNIKVNVGTSTEVAAQTAYFGELDAQLILENAAREAAGYRFQGSEYNTSAALTRRTSSDISPYLAAAPSILTGASAVVDSLLQFR